MSLESGPQPHISPERSPNEREPVQQEAIGQKELREAWKEIRRDQESEAVIEEAAGFQRPRSRLGKWLRGTLAGASLSLSALGCSTPGQWRMPSSDELNHTNEKLEQISGVEDIGSVLERYGYVPKIRVPNGGGKYMVHIGQVHEPAGGGVGEHGGNIIHSQESIEHLVRDLKDNGMNIPYIYAEPLTPKKLWILEDEREEIETIMSMDNTLESLADLAAYNDKLSKDDPVYLEYGINKKADEIISDLESAGSLREADRSRFEELRSEFGSEEDRYETALGERFGEHAVYMNDGAAFKLYYDGVCDLRPAADPDEMADLKALLYQIEEVRGKIEIREKRGEEVPSDLREKAEELSETFIRKKMEPREDTVVSMIAGAAHDSSEQFHITPYGLSHSFGNNVETYNQEHPDQEIGLITIQNPDIYNKYAE